MRCEANVVVARRSALFFATLGLALSALSAFLRFLRFSRPDDGGGGGDDDDEVPERQNGVLFGKKIHHHQQQHQEQQHLCVLEECWQRPKLRDDETKIILDFGVIIVVIVARGVFFLSSKNGSDDGRVRRGELRRFRSRARPGV